MGRRRHITHCVFRYILFLLIAFLLPKSTPPLGVYNAFAKGEGACSQTYSILELENQPVHVLIDRPPLYDPILLDQQKKLPAQQVSQVNSGGISVIEQGEEIVYARTNRSLKSGFSRFYTDGLADLQGKRVLDAGTGDGAMVQDLRQNGVEAFGLDIHLNIDQQTKPYYLKASVEQTALASEQFDLILSGYSALFYRKDDLPFIVSTLKEFSRILKQGGKIRIEPTDRSMIEKALKEIPGLELEAATDAQQKLRSVSLRKKL